MATFSKIDTIFEPVKKTRQHGVVDVTSTLVRRQIPLRDVGCVIGFVNQHVIPGFVFGRLRYRHLLIPFFSAAEFWIDVVHDASILEATMFNLLSNKEFERFLGYKISQNILRMKL